MRNFKSTHNINLHNTTKEKIKKYFNETFDIYEKLFENLINDEAYYRRADPLRHPIIFYFGHTATFFINKLILAKLIDTRINASLESIFAVGVDEMSWDDLNESHYNWPSVKETKKYRDKTRVVVNNLIDSLELTLPITWDSDFWAILMGIEHERIHLETSSVLIRQLPIKFIKKSDFWKVNTNDHLTPTNSLIQIDGAEVKLGKSFNDKYFGWDNEYGTHNSFVESFKASKYLVSNGEFLEFVEQGGYEDDFYWENEGLEWKKKTKTLHPTFWIFEGGVYKLRLLNEITPLLLSHPVDVNYHEAKAFCNYKSHKDGCKYRLPSEDEYQRILDFCNVNEDDNPQGNINLLNSASSVPVDSFSFGSLYDVKGNAWQWSESTIYPFEGFSVHPLYDDFSTPTFDKKHNLMKGGSWVSTGNETLNSARYAFRKHFFQHAGFRYIKSSKEIESVQNMYESDFLISQYCEFGWGKKRYFGIKNYSKHSIKLIDSYLKDMKTTKALDIGCAIGRSSFELAKKFDKVIGVDFTARFIQLATKLKEGKSINYTIQSEGDLEKQKTISLKNYKLDKYASKVEFWQGDACNLKPMLTNFDLIFASNLIDRLYDPKKFLNDLSHRLNKNGLLVLTSPYTWLEEYTPKSKWIGGYKKKNKDFKTIEGLKEILENEFILLDTKDVEFVIKETERKYQHSIAQMSIWRKS